MEIELRSMKQVFSAELPLSPSMNAYWKAKIGWTRQGKPYPIIYVSKQGIKFQQEVSKIVMTCGPRTMSAKRLCLWVWVHMKKDGEQDIDNRIKPLLDALQKAGVFLNDSQIDTLLVYRGEIKKDGALFVTVLEL